MDREKIPPENISQIIEQVLKAKDPATVGLRKILRKKDEAGRASPLSGEMLQQFEIAGKKNTKLSEEDQHVLMLEKRVADLQVELKKQQEQTRQAIQSAYAKGKKEGIDEGTQQASALATGQYEAKINAMQDQIASFLRAIEVSKSSIASNLEHVTLRLSLEMVKKIISQEVSLQPELVLSVLKKSLTYIGDREKIVVRVAPDDFEQVSGRQNFWLPIADRLKNITIEPDSRISKGGCILESNSGVIDAQLGVQFEELAMLVEKEWEHAAAAAHDVALRLPDVQ